MVNKTVVCAALSVALVSLGSTASAKKPSADDRRKAAQIADDIRERTKKFAEKPDSEQAYKNVDDSLKECVEHTLALIKNGADKRTELTLADGSKITLIQAWKECRATLKPLKKYDAREARKRGPEPPPEMLEKATKVVYQLRNWNKEFDKDERHYHVLDSAFNGCAKHIKPMYKWWKTALIPQPDDEASVTVEGAWKECREVARKLDKYDKAKKSTAQKKLDAQLAPYKKVLKGEKLSFFTNNKFYEIELFGKRGVRLTSPKALQKANLWFVAVNYEENGRTWWELRRYEFNKGKYKGMTEKRGRGRNPPSRAFR